MSGESARKIVYTPLDEIAPADRNPKAHNETLIADAIGRFGFVEPLVLDERTGKLVAGHGRLEQLRSMEADGVEPPDGIEVGDDGWCAPVVRGWASADDGDAEAAAVALNRTSELGGWDDALLLDVLSGQENLDGLGYTDDDLAAMVVGLSGYDGYTEPELSAVTEPVLAPPEPRMSAPSAPVEPVDSPRPSSQPANDRVILEVPLSATERRRVVDLLSQARQRAAVDTLGEALVWALERSPAALEIDVDQGRRMSAVLREALAAVVAGDQKRLSACLEMLEGFLAPTP